MRKFEQVEDIDQIKRMNKLPAEFEDWVINYHYPDFKYNDVSACYQRIDEINPNISLFVSKPELTGLMVDFLVSNRIPIMLDEKLYMDLKYRSISVFDCFANTVKAVIGDVE